MKIPQQLLAPIVGVLAGCFGIGVGLIIRQPEINELHRQVAKLQKKADELKETVRKQNDEISALITRYRALQVWQVIQKHDLRKQIEESLVFQYAMNDYFSLMVDRLETGRDFNEAETAFYAAFSKMLDGKELDADQMESVKSYVEATHSAQIEAMTPCDASEPIERIRNFEDGKKERFFHLPQKSTRTSSANSRYGFASTPLPQTHKSAAEQVVQLAAHPAPSGIDSSLQQQRVH